MTFRSLVNTNTRSVRVYMGDVKGSVNVDESHTCSSSEKDILPFVHHHLQHPLLFVIKWHGLTFTLFRIRRNREQLRKVVIDLLWLFCWPVGIISI